MSDDILVEKTTGRTAILTINRPESRNSLLPATGRRLAEAMNALGADADVRCIVITGAGGHFSAGADLRGSFVDDPNLMENLEAVMDGYNAMIMSLVRNPKPVIASMDGAAVGIGADLAFACDLRVAATTAYAQEKFVRIGLMPDGGGTFWLPRLLGTARAMKAMLLGDKMEAKELDALGLLAACVPKEQLRAATMELAQRLENGPPLAIAAMKEAVYASLGDLESALKRERLGQLRLLKTEDAIEGVAAFVQKRDPSFKGR
jgi:enoyl-CoA hydratase/carnithine racemase